MNRCDEEKEYRCINGMRILQEFFLDGDLDCLDWSDQHPSQKDWNCFEESARGGCDNHLCPLNDWSHVGMDTVMLVDWHLMDRLCQSSIV